MEELENACTLKERSDVVSSESNWSLRWKKHLRVPCWGVFAFLLRHDSILVDSLGDENACDLDAFETSD